MASPTAAYNRESTRKRDEADVVSKGLPPPRPFPPSVLPCVDVDVDVVAVDCDEVTNEDEATEGAWVNVWDVAIGIEVACVELKDASVVDVVGTMMVKLVVLKVVDCVGVEFDTEVVVAPGIVVKLAIVCDVEVLDVVVTAGVEIVDRVVDVALLV